jgi:predicted ATPase
VIALATEQGLPDWLAWATTIRGWALAAQGQVEEGIAQLQQGLAASRATGAELLRPWLLAPLAAAYGKKGQPEEGLRVVAEALSAVHKNQVRHYEAELLRLKGELLLKKSEARMQDPTPSP